MGVECMKVKAKELGKIKKINERNEYPLYYEEAIEWIQNPTNKELLPILRNQCEELIELCVKYEGKKEGECFKHGKE